MSLLNVALMTFSELWGNAHFKMYTRNGNHAHLIAGVLGYIGVIAFLIKSLSVGTLLWVSAMWEGMIVVFGSLVAVFVLGENFESPVQWIGVGLGLVSMFLVHYGGDIKLR